MNKFVLASVASMFLLLSCSKKTVTTITPIGASASLSPKGMAYSLPKTALRVKVNAEFKSVSPGPYAKFAKKYLGISSVILEAQKKWSISDIEVVPHSLPDLSLIFVIEPAESFSLDFLRITEQGLIIPLSNSDYRTVKKSVHSLDSYDTKNVFLDLSATPFIAAEKTTHYSRVVQDSSFVRVPIHKSVVVERSVEEKAREAADFIFSLRKRRVELLSGDADFVAEGKAVEAVLNEISRLEDEYLSLFTGKITSSKAIHYFDYTPVANGDNASSILFRFSNTRGVLSSSDLSGSPVLISLTITEKWQGTGVFDQLITEKGKPRLDAVYYRLPIPVEVKIHDSENDFFQQVLTLSQFGPLLRMPSRLVVE
ncbi:MAG: DUF4831 family protein [Bacteroidales bacterium]